MTIVLIPAFNACHTIAEAVILSRRYANRVIVFNDGSKDMTTEIASRCGAEVIGEKENHGQGYALRKLFHYVQGTQDIVVTLDADMQHNPKDIRRLIQPILNGNASFVIGSRQNQSLFRNLGNKIIEIGIRHESQSGFRAFHPSLLNQLVNIKSNGFSSGLEINIMLKDVKTEHIPIKIKYDKYSHSKNIAYSIGDLIAWKLKN